MTASRLLVSLVLIAAVGTVTACGRRSSNERPVDAQWEADRDAARKARQPAPPKPSRETPERPFILDSLID
jgi:predicted small lipoprotein YifL